MRLEKVKVFEGQGVGIFSRDLSHVNAKSEYQCLGLGVKESALSFVYSPCWGVTPRYHGISGIPGNFLNIKAQFPAPPSRPILWTFCFQVYFLHLGQGSINCSLQAKSASTLHFFCMAHELIFKWPEKKELFHDIWKLHEIQISTSINKVLLECSHYM